MSKSRDQAGTWACETLKNCFGMATSYEKYGLAPVTTEPGACGQLELVDVPGPMSWL